MSGRSWVTDILGYFALQNFIKQMASATDGSTVEALWGKFMNTFQPSYLTVGADLLPEAFRDRILVNALIAAFGQGAAVSTGAYAMYIAGTIAEGAMIGAEGAEIEIGYQLRLQWYINDIDSD